MIGPPGVELLSESVALVVSLVEEFALPELVGVPPLKPALAVAPTPSSGSPKKPMAVGALFCPRRIGFQSSFPVIGSAYRFRRKRMLLVMTSASMLVG